MKHIILEGVDRIGKNSLINNLLRNSSNYIVRHFTTPIGNTNEERISIQKEDFLFEFRFSMLRKKLKKITKTENDFLIWNRSHIGEWVFGQLYRKYTPDWIFEYESLFAFNEDKTVYLILLTADAEFAFSKEDGKSLSNTLEERKKELELFDEAFEKSLIKNKLKIKVDENGEFRNQEDIYNEAINFIHSK